MDRQDFLFQIASLNRTIDNLNRTISTFHEAIELLKKQHDEYRIGTMAFPRKSGNHKKQIFFTPSLSSYSLDINALECRICVWLKNISAKGNMLSSLRRKYIFGTPTPSFSMNMTQVKKLYLCEATLNVIELLKMESIQLD